MPTLPSRALAAVVVATAVLAAACSGGASEAGVDQGQAPTSTSRQTAPPSSAGSPTEPATATAPAADPAPVLVAAGDIACVPGEAATAWECQDEATADVVESLSPDVVAPLGDLQYERGERVNFDASYDRSWGRFRDRTHPAPGNHEYAGGRAPGYYGYFGAAAEGADGRGWGSYDLGAWHVVVLNSVCSAIGGCGQGSDQLAWLRRDLAANDRPCTLAYWHHPRWSSGFHGSDDGYQPFWDALSAAGADVVLGGHDHHYERFAPVGGIRQFVVGTGGRSLYPVLLRQRGSEAVDARTFGVLALTLRPDGYDWRFVAIPGAASGFGDEGSAGC